MQKIAVWTGLKLQHVARLTFILFLLTMPAKAQNFLREELRIPHQQAGPKGLQALLIRPAGGGRYPLAVINHGSPRDRTERAKMTPASFVRQAEEFAKRGWTTVIVMRRGYGDSAGEYAESTGCNNADYVTVGRAGAADIRTAIEFLKKRPDVDPERIISVGQSAGGFSAVALTENAPGGLVAVINFAGGRGSRKPDEVCAPERLIGAFAEFGKKSSTPMLWIYAQNDRYFSATLSRKFHEAFVKAGGKAEYSLQPAFGDDGHRLFARGVKLWTPVVDEFLRKQGLPALPQ